MNNFYEGQNWRENFFSVLQHYMSIFSEGNPPIVPIIGDPVSVSKTLQLPCYMNFPEREKAIWLESEKKALGIEDQDK